MRISTLFGSLAVLFAFALTSCEQVESPTEIGLRPGGVLKAICPPGEEPPGCSPPPEEDPPPPDESIQWVGNTLDFTDDNGHRVRFIRNSQSATLIKAYRYENGAYRHKYTADIVRNDNDIVSSKVRGTGSNFDQWVKVNSDGQVTDTNACSPGEPGCDLAFGGDFNDSCVTFASTTTLRRDPCDGPKYAFIAAAGGFIGSLVGLGAAWVLPGGQPFVPTMARTAIATGIATLGTYGAYRTCASENGDNGCALCYNRGPRSQGAISL